MKFIANENFPIASLNFLQANKWDITHVASAMSGISDKEVMDHSIKEERIIITFDRDYGELVFNKGYKPYGVIYLRIQKFFPDFPGKLLLKLSANKELDFQNYFTVIDENQIRQRKI